MWNAKPYCYHCWKEMSVHVYESRIHEPRSISKFHLPADYHPDPIHLWLSRYRSSRCPVLLCSASGFTQPHFTLHHSPHIRLWAWYELLSSGTLPERELIKCQLTWAQPECRPPAVNLAPKCAGGQYNNAVAPIFWFCFRELYLEIHKFLFVSGVVIRLPNTPLQAKL